MSRRIYVLGAGAVGLSVAAFLKERGRDVVLVRTSAEGLATHEVEVTMRMTEGTRNVTVKAVSFSELGRLEGLVVVTTKAYANEELAARLRKKGVRGTTVVLQNGLGVEKAFVELGAGAVLRGVLYVTAERMGEREVTFRAIRSSPIGVVSGDGAEEGVRELTTPDFPFHVEGEIGREVWKKAIMNAVFNSICPLLEVDNGIFARDETAAGLAREVVAECRALAEREGAVFQEEELMAQVMAISRGGEGVLISTLQDIRAGRETEIEALNLEMARRAGALGIELARTEILGRMIGLKAGLFRRDKKLEEQGKRSQP